MQTDFTAPGSILIEKIEIENYDKSKTIDISPLIREFNIYESMSGSFLTVDFLIEDGLSLTSTLPIVGQETISLVFKTPHPSFKKNIDLTLRVVSVVNMTRDKARSSFYILKCVPPQMIKDNQTKVRKSFMNMPINQMINELTNTYLEIETIVESEETEGTRTITIPNMNPTRAIGFLTKEAKSKENPASNFRFFQNCDGFFFKTLEKCIQPDAGKVNTAFKDRYFASDTDLDKDAKDQKDLFGNAPSALSKKDSKPRDFLKLMNFSFINLGNYYETARHGGLESKMRMFDPVTSYYAEKTYNFKTNSKDFKKTSEDKGHDLLTEEADYFSKESESRVYFLFTNSQQQNGKIEADQKEDMFHLKIASEFLFENILVNVTIAGDSEKRIGETILLEFPEYGATDDIQGKLNKYVSGEYLILSLRHIYNDKGYSTTMICSKNCYEKEISNFESTERK